MIPTAEEFFNKNFPKISVIEVMKKFAEIHCEEQVKQLQKFAEENTVWGREKKDEILNKYPLSNIK